MADQDDDEFAEKLAYTFEQMGGKVTGTINYMNLRKWISAQMKADDELEGVKGITDEMQKASTDAFAAHKNDDDLLGLDEIAGLLKELDLLKYMPEEIPEPEPEPVEEGLSTDELTKMLEESHAEVHDLKVDLKAAKKETKKVAAELEEMEDDLDAASTKSEVSSPPHLDCLVPDRLLVFSGGREEGRGADEGARRGEGESGCAHTQSPPQLELQGGLRWVACVLSGGRDGA